MDTARGLFYGLDDSCESELALVLIKIDNTKIQYSWGDYRKNIDYAVAGLRFLDINPGDLVAVIAINLPEAFFVMSALIKLGAVTVPINYPLIKEPDHKELKSILDDCEPRLVLINQCLIKYMEGSGIECASFEDILNKGRRDCGDTNSCFGKEVDTNRNNLFIMPYTSGTTGKSRGVMLSYRNILDRVEAIGGELKVSRQEKLLSYLTLGHISELIATFFGQLRYGYTVYFTEYIKYALEDREKLREALPKILQSAKPTIFLAVPKVWTNIRKGIEKKTKYIPIQFDGHGLLRNWLVNKIKTNLGFDGVRHFISAASKLSHEDKFFFSKLGIHIKDVYGQTETAGPLTIDGRVIGTTDLFIGWNDEILVAGHCLMLGYYKDEQASMKVLENPLSIPANRIYRTGDMGIWQTYIYEDFRWQSLRFDPGAKVFYGGRLGDGFKLAQGEFVSAHKIEELEGQLKQIDGIDEVIVCGEGKAYLVALIFTSQPIEKLKNNLGPKVNACGEGLFKIKNFILLPTETLELTPTLKIKRKAVIKKYQAEIDKM